MSNVTASRSRGSTRPIPTSGWLKTDALVLALNPPLRQWFLDDIRNLIDTKCAGRVSRNFVYEVIAAVRARAGNRVFGRGLRGTVPRHSYPGTVDSREQQNRPLPTRHNVVLVADCRDALRADL